METAHGLNIPIQADFVVSPQVYYAGPLTGIYFETEDEHFGRITFENLDALKVSRGELIPYEYEWKEGQPYCWVFKVKNSNWLRERYDYEKEHYGRSYEFVGNVDEMQSDFHHFVFKFHDEFVEAIARGFWFEKSSESLFGKALTEGHPFLPLPKTNMTKIEAHGLVCQVRINPKPIEELKKNTEFCSQNLLEFAFETDGDNSVQHTLVLSWRNDKLITTLRGIFGKQEKEIDGVGTLADVRTEIESYMKDVYERIKAKMK